MDGNSPSLAVRLMQVAADYELEKKAEREALEREIDRLHERNRDLDRRVWSQNKQIEEMGQKLSEVTSEMQKRTQSVDEHIDALTRELIAVKFAFADCVKLLERIRRNHEDLPEFQSAPGYLEDMARDADLHSRDMLYLAAEEGLEEIVKSILSPTCSSHDELAETFGYAVNRAAGAGHLGIMKHLLAVGANPFAVSEDDYTLRTALHRTASAGHEHIVRYLLDKASSLINSQDVHGCTALHVAVAGGHAHVVKHLLLAGCDVDIRNDSGETALDVSKKTKSAAVQSVLQDATVRFWNCSVRANKLYSDKLFDGAIKCYSEAIELAPEGSVVRKAAAVFTCLGSQLLLRQHRGVIWPPSTTIAPELPTAWAFTVTRLMTARLLWTTTAHTVTRWRSVRSVTWRYSILTLQYPISSHYWT